MNDYISVQEAIEKINERARETFTLALGYEHYLGALHDVADDLRQIPIVDAVPVVRCKDCKHLFTDFVMDGKEYKRCEMQMAGFHDDWFCADGERKDI